MSLEEEGPPGRLVFRKDTGLEILTSLWLGFSLLQKCLFVFSVLSTHPALEKEDNPSD